MHALLLLQQPEIQYKVRLTLNNKVFRIIIDYIITIKQIFLCATAPLIVKITTANHIVNK